MNMTNAARLASLLHPARQNLVIAEVRELNRTTKLFVLKSAEDKALACFEAGCYIPVFAEIDGNTIERPYSLCSSPKEASEGIYKIVVKESVGGYVSTHIIRNWKVGDHVTFGSPKEAEVYSPIRDCKHVAALAGGVGITPFFSIAQAVVDGDNDHDLTVFYGANTLEELLFREEWARLAEKSGGRIRMIPVIANETAEGCEQGFITLDIMKKYIDPMNVSFFISGPPPMVRAMKEALAPLALPRGRIRISMNGDSGFNHSRENGSDCLLTVHMGGEIYRIPAKTNETVLVALEKGGLKPAVYCRSGVCGFCRSMVISGDFTPAAEEDGVRKMDRYFGFIHPCCSYPDGDMELVVQREK